MKKKTPGLFKSIFNKIPNFYHSNKFHIHVHTRFNTCLAQSGAAVSLVTLPTRSHSSQIFFDAYLGPN